MLVQIDKQGRGYYANQDYTLNEDYNQDDISFHADLIADKHELAKYTNDKRKSQNRNMRFPHYLFDGLENKGENFLKAIQDEEIYHEIEPIIHSAGLNIAIKKANQLLEAKYLESSLTGNKTENNYNFQNAQIGAASFAGRDNIGNVTNNNYSNSDSDLEETVQNIENLIKDLSAKSPIDKSSEQMSVASQAIATIEANPDWKQKAIIAGKQGLLEAIKTNFIGAFVVNAIKSWQND